MLPNGRIVITGASGWLAQELMSTLSERCNNCRVIGISRSAPFAITDADCMDNTAFLKEFSFVEGDVLVHCAFERGPDGKGLMESLDYSGKCFSKAIGGGASIVNISSQAVYGSTNGPCCSERSPFAPDYLYALAKASSEMVLESLWGMGRSACGGRTSLRLASLMGVSGGRAPDNVLGKFIDAAIGGKPIRIVGGGQKFSFLDIHDAVGAIISILDMESSKWMPAYNVTPGSQIGIVEMADLVVSTVSRKMGAKPVQVILEKTDTSLDPGGDNSLIRGDTGWKQERSMAQIVEDTVDFKLARRAEGNG